MNLKEQVDALIPLADAATAGPWQAQTIERMATWHDLCTAGGYSLLSMRLSAATFRRSQDAAFIAAARSLDYRALAAPAAPVPAASPWVACDGVADYQAEEEYVWVAQAGEVTHGMWKECYWEDDEQTGHPLPDRFVWAKEIDEGHWLTMIPQPTHFQPKPTPPATA